MTDSLEWTCPSCGAGSATPYCSACGERQPRPSELTLRGLLDQALHAFTSLDGRLLRTLIFLLRHPGRLTELYLEGARKSYVGPFALFLLANVLFVAVESITHLNIFSTPLQEHLQHQPWSDLAQRLVAQRLEATGRTIEIYRPVFDLAVADNAKSLVILMVLPFALLVGLVFHGRRRPFAAHLAFSLHFHGFMLVLISAALLIPAVDLLFGGVGLASRSLDNGIAIGLLVVCATYLYLATKTVYGAVGVGRFFKSAALIAASATIFLAYRFLLLLLTLYST